MDIKPKQFAKSHRIGKKAVDIVKEKLPDHWVIREVNPDYGVDLNIEVFEEETDGKCYTLGQYIYAQVKGTESPLIEESYKVNEVYNVEIKNKVLENTSDEKVIKYVIDTSSILTYEKMGAGMPILLFIVDLTIEEVYFICMNDYIDKILINSFRTYKEQKTITLLIPTNNKLNKENIFVLEYFSLRSKLYDLFLRINYQYDKIKYMDTKTLIDSYRYMIDRLLILDVWNYRKKIPYIAIYYDKIVEIKKQNVSFEKTDNDEEAIWEFNGDEGFLLTEIQNDFLHKLIMLWSSLSVLSGNYEEYHRNSYLPTYINRILND